MNAKKELKSYYLIDKKIENIQADYEKALNSGTKVTSSISAMPTSRGVISDKVGKFATEMAELSTEKQKQLQYNIEIKNRIETKIARIMSKYSVLLHRIYIENKLLKDVAIEFNISYDTAKDWHKQALEEYEKLKER